MNVCQQGPIMLFGNCCVICVVLLVQAKPKVAVEFCEDVRSAEAVQGLTLSTPESTVLAQGLTFEAWKVWCLSCLHCLRCSGEAKRSHSDHRTQWRWALSLRRDTRFSNDANENVKLLISPLRPPEAGKTALARVLLGLWPGKSVKLAVPPSFSIVPQRPYLAPGCLGDQVTYPKRFGKDDEVNAWKALEKVGLLYLLQRGDRNGRGVKEEFFGKTGGSGSLRGVAEGWLVECDWEDQLSGGEQQRLALSRVLFHRPMFAVLDECTSMVAADAEEKLYQTVVSSDITPVTMSQRLFLPQLHSKELRLGVDNPSKWSLVRDLRGWRLTIVWEDCLMIVWSFLWALPYQAQLRNGSSWAVWRGFNGLACLVLPYTRLGCSSICSWEHVRTDNELSKKMWLVPTRSDPVLTRHPSTWSQHTRRKNGRFVAIDFSKADETKKVGSTRWHEPKLQRICWQSWDLQTCHLQWIA